MGSPKTDILVKMNRWGVALANFKDDARDFFPDRFVDECGQDHASESEAPPFLCNCDIEK